MIRTLALAASALALIASPALAQMPDVASALPRPIPPIPEAREIDYPGVIRLTVDATDLDRKIMRVRQTIPVAGPGPMVLLYPKYLPGNHAATGPIQLVSGLQISAAGQRLDWIRDPVDPWAFHIEVPEGVQAIDLSFDFLSQHDGWRVLMTPEMVNLQFEKHMLYPAGYAHNRIQIEPTVVLPQGWRFGVALDPVEAQGDTTRFAPVTVEMLSDSPMFAGAHYAEYDLDPGGRIPVRMHVFADEPRDIQPTEEQLSTLRNLVVQADRLYGARSFDRYEFLVALTDTLGGIGLEHHRSSENTVARGFFRNWPVGYGNRELLPHEYAHAWNGKRQRPADQLTANLNIPLRNSLVWMYEGQSQYWGAVLAARSGLVTADEAMINLANITAFYENQPGREWRPLQDTGNHNLMGYRGTTPWPSWSRSLGDYYREALLVWLDADTLIREQTRGRRSLDDFARGFLGGDDGSWTPRPYTFEDIVEALNAVHPHDWAGFLRARLDAAGPAAEAPLDGITRGGWRLTYVEEPNALEKRMNAGWERDFQYSLGFTLTPTNRLSAVLWGAPAFEAGLVNGWELVAVNDRAASPALLREAVTAGKTGGPIRLLVKEGDRYRTVNLAWTGGLRHPRLERVAGTPDRLADVFAPRRR